MTLSGALLKLENPFQSLWKDHDPAFSAVETPRRDGSQDKKVLLFIHGLEYRSPREVIDDLVRPFERHAGIFANAKKLRHELWIFHWPSCMNEGIHYTEADDMNHQRGWQRLRFALTRPWKQSIEARIRAAASCLEPLWSEDGSSSAHFSKLQDLCVVSHSLGSCVWAEALRQAQQRLQHAEHDVAMDPGHWLCLQPALDYDAFAPNGQMRSVGDIFSRMPHRRASVFYSRFDWVLQGLYRPMRKKPALGLTASNLGKPFVGYDVSWQALEAHNQVRLFAQSACFFGRVQDCLRQELCEIGWRRPQLTSLPKTPESKPGTYWLRLRSQWSKARMRSKGASMGMSCPA